MEKQLDDVHHEGANHHESILDDLKKTQTVDTVHNDEALKVLAHYSGDQDWTEKEEKQLRHKVDRRLLSILCITYGLQYYDKAMLGQAALFGLREDLQLQVGIRYSMASSIFYMGFICGAYPAILLAQRYPIEKVATGIIVLWGVTLMCTAAVQGWKGLYAQRFFLGFLESGISPMFMLVVGGWYKKNEQALRMGAWYCCTGYVSIVSPLINYGLGHIKGKWSSWRYMYLVAGVVTILWSIVIYFFMPPDPIRAKGFTDRERYIAVARMKTNNAGVRNTHFKVAHLLDAATDLKFWLAFSMSFLLMVANGPVSSFTPIIINGFGFTGLTSLLLTMPAGFVSGTIELVAPYAAYKIPRVRTYIIFLCECGTIMAAVLLWKLPRTAKGGLLFGVYFLPSFGGAYAVMMGLQIANTAGYTKRSVTSSGLFIGYCLGNILGPFLFKVADAPGYAPGFRATVATSVVAAVLSMVYRFYCIWENKRRDKTGKEGFEHAYEDDLTDRKNPQFRYTI
ncbi:MFS transporter [Tothia fuscella]|uniref:MFS transporter n=1 Tax=Tothia fuscella TaxID=1048955 RepID=A0A9P4NL59_9PEZI|nr:MFS transporter [Tothia fuscella]